jgi:hypothetical protein
MPGRASIGDPLRGHVPEAPLSAPETLRALADQIEAARGGRAAGLEHQLASIVTSYAGAGRPRGVDAGLPYDDRFARPVGANSYDRAPYGPRNGRDAYPPESPGCPMPEPYPAPDEPHYHHAPRARSLPPRDMPLAGSAKRGASAAPLRQAAAPADPPGRPGKEHKLPQAVYVQRQQLRWLLKTRLAQVRSALAITDLFRCSHAPLGQVV